MNKIKIVLLLRAQRIEEKIKQIKGLDLKTRKTRVSPSLK